MQAAHYRSRRSNELLGTVVITFIGMAVLVAFAISPMGTLAAGIVALVAYPLAGRNDTGSAPLRLIQRASLVVATLGVGAAFLLF